MNIGLERPDRPRGGAIRTTSVSSSTTPSARCTWMGWALNVRMYERPGESLGVFATDDTVEVRNASIARGLKRK